MSNEDAHNTEDRSEPGNEAEDTEALSVEELREQLEQCRQERDEYLAGWKRAKADLMNYKEGERSRLDKRRTDGEERVLNYVFPIIDNFDRAMEAATDTKEQNELMEGVRSIRREFDTLLEQFGVERIDAEGKQFNPDLHEAVSQVESEEHEAGEVIAQVHAGYKRGDKLLRPAQVQVAQ